MCGLESVVDVDDDVGPDVVTGILPDVISVLPSSISSSTPTLTPGPPLSSSSSSSSSSVLVVDVGTLTMTDAVKLGPCEFELRRLEHIVEDAFFVFESMDGHCERLCKATPSKPSWTICSDTPRSLGMPTCIFESSSLMLYSTPGPML